MITVACALSSQPRRYSAADVRALRRQVQRRARFAHRFVCLEGGRGSWSKLQAFDPAFQPIGARVWFFNLGVRIFAPFDDESGEFIIPVNRSSRPWDMYCMAWTVSERTQAIHAAGVDQNPFGVERTIARVMGERISHFRQSFCKRHEATGTTTRRVAGRGSAADVHPL